MSTRIPRGAEVIDSENGTAESGATIRARLWRHGRFDGSGTWFYIEQGVLTPGGTFVGAPQLDAYSGTSAESRARKEFAKVRELLVASRAPQPA